MGIFLETAKLKSRCRVSSAADPDVLEIFAEAERRAASWFWTNLGGLRVAELISYASPVLLPVNDQEASRMKAENAETSYVLAQLLDRLPTLFLSAQYKTRSNFNDNATSRKQDEDLQAQIGRLMAEAEQLVKELDAGDTPQGSEDGISNEPALIGPQGDSIMFNSVGRDLTIGEWF